MNKKNIAARPDPWIDLKYSLTFCACALLILLPVALINFIYDPGEIYFQRMVKDKYADDYAKMLLSSDVGVKESTNERIVKAHMAQHASPYKTVIFGSSRIMQLSPLHMPNFQNYFPAPALNLGASAWTIEDTLIFTHILLHNDTIPQAIVISVDPWTLRWNLSPSYLILEDHFKGMLDELGIKKTTQKPEHYLIKLLTNSISYNYFVQSLKRLSDPSFNIIPKNDFKDWPQANAADFVNGFDFDQGYDYQLTLKDGARLFSKENVWEMIYDYNQGHVGYIGQQGAYWDDNAVDVFEKLINYVQKKGIKVYFVLLPFSPLVYDGQHTADQDRFLAVEQKIREIASRNNIKVFGTYDAQKSHMQATNFFDFQHPRPSTLRNFDFSH